MEEGVHCSVVVAHQVIYLDNWKKMMRVRIAEEFAKLTADGTLWVIVGGLKGTRYINGAAHLKLIADEIFGEKNFVANVVWQHTNELEEDEPISWVHTDILVYSKSFSLFKKKANRSPLSEERMQAYQNPDNDPRGRWHGVNMQSTYHRDEQCYWIVSPTGKRHWPKPGYAWRMIESTYLETLADNRIYFGPNGDQRPVKKIFLEESRGVNSWTWWPHSELQSLEQVLDRIKNLATREGETFIVS